jgi:hypothetical protein
VTSMTINLAAVVIDAAKLEPESAFWHRLPGGSITKSATLQLERTPLLSATAVG